MPESPPSAHSARRWPWRPRLGAVLLLVNLLILALPVAGIAALRLYEDELVQGTEAQLLVLGASLRELYRNEYLRVSGAAPAPVPVSSSANGALDPFEPRLGVRNEQLLPPAPPAADPSVPADPVAVAAGRALGAALERTSQNTLVGLRIVDRHGIVVATSRSELGLSLVARDEVREALNGTLARRLRVRRSHDPQAPEPESISRGQRYRVFMAVPVIEGERVIGAVVLSRTPLDIAKALYLKRRPLIVGAAVSLAVVLLVSGLTTLTINRPIHALIRQAGRVVAGDRAAVVEIAHPGTREIEQLSRALAAMARTLEGRATYINTLATHISHEFKTPLTSIRGAAELLRDHAGEMSEAERDRFIDNVASSAERLDRLVRRLLDLARADTLADPAASTLLGPVIDAVASRFRENGLDVHVHHNAGDTRVAIGAEALDDVLSNLCENARVHGGPGVRVTIRSAPGPEARSAHVVVEDDGPGVSEANLPRVFTPFFTTAREHGGSGLGLAIVRALLEAHGGSIALDGPGPGARFTLRIPAKN